MVPKCLLTVVQHKTWILLTQFKDELGETWHNERAVRLITDVFTPSLIASRAAQEPNGTELVAECCSIPAFC